MRMPAEGDEPLLRVMTGGTDQQTAQGGVDVVRAVAWTAGRAVVVSGRLERWNMRRNDQSVGCANDGVEILSNPACRCISQLGHQDKASGLIQFTEIVDAPMVGVANAGLGSPAAAGVRPPVMSEQHCLPVKPNRAMILEVMQVGDLLAKLPDLGLCGVERGTVKVMIPQNHEKRAWRTGMGECFEMRHKCSRGGGIARNNGGVILGVFEVTEQFSAVFCRCLVKMQVAHPK